MTTRNDLDRLITQVAGELTRADATGFGARVRARLDRTTVPHRAPLRGFWAATCAAGAVIAILMVSIRSFFPAPALPSIASNSTPAAAVEPASVAVTPPAAGAIAGPKKTRARRPATPAMSAAELAWLARALPPLPDPAPVEVRGVDLANLEPRGVNVPGVAIDPLPSRDINK